MIRRETCNESLFSGYSSEKMEFTWKNSSLLDASPIVFIVLNVEVYNEF